MTNELYHYGVPGMKWGRRILRGHAGPGVYIGSKKRRLKKHKADLDALNKGEHLSFGITKKRQEMYDRRDKAALEKKINKLEDSINYSKMSKSEKVSYRSKKKVWSDDATEAAKIKTKKLNQMSNSELRKLNDRKNLERNYKQLNPNTFKKGLMLIGGTAATLGSIAAIKKNSPTLLKKGASVVNNAFTQAGSNVATLFGNKILNIKMGKLR